VEAPVSVPTERVLTVKQPWADLIMVGKDVENRSWPVPRSVSHWDPWNGSTQFPFRLWVHAATAIDRDAVWRLDRTRLDSTEAGRLIVDWCAFLGTTARYRGELAACDRLGVLLGSVTVTACHHADDCDDGWSCSGGAGSWCSPWAEPDCWHWTLADPQPLAEPIPMRGRQRLWRLPEDAGVARG
jgi:hypothetical protein